MHDLQEILDPLKNPITFAVPFFALTIAVELAALRWLDHDGGEGGGTAVRGYEARDSRASLLMGLGSLVSTTIFKVGSFFVFTAAFVYLAAWELPTDTWWYWVLLTLVLDLLFYANHRFVHRVNVGWAAHQAHHSSEYMNFTTALRQKWNPWFELLFFLPLPLLGFAPWTIYLAFAFNLIYQFAVHTELVDKLWAPIELVLQHPLAPPGPPRLRPGVPRQQLRGDPHRLGPPLRHVRGRAAATDVRPDHADRHLRRDDPAVRSLRAAVARPPGRHVGARPLGAALRSARTHRAAGLMSLVESDVPTPESSDSPPELTWRFWILPAVLSVLLVALVATSVVLLLDRRDPLPDQTAVVPADIGSGGVGRCPGAAGGRAGPARRAHLLHPRLLLRRGRHGPVARLGTPGFVEEYDETAGALATRVTGQRLRLSASLPRRTAWRPSTSPRASPRSSSRSTSPPAAVGRAAPAPTAPA